jgi:hypothetical protein
MNCEVNILFNQVFFSLLPMIKKIILQISQKRNTCVFVFSKCCLPDFVHAVNIDGYLVWFSDIVTIEVPYLTELLFLLCLVKFKKTKTYFN